MLLIFSKLKQMPLYIISQHISNNLGLNILYHFRDSDTVSDIVRWGSLSSKLLDNLPKIQAIRFSLACQMQYRIVTA